jgi:hypothetical protein
MNMTHSRPYVFLTWQRGPWAVYTNVLNIVLSKTVSCTVAFIYNESLLMTINYNEPK